MVEEITNLDRIHLVNEIEDIKLYLSDEQKKQLSNITKEIRSGRIRDGKKERNYYLVLNLDDEIDLDYFGDQFFGDEFDEKQIIKVKDIAVTLVNAILKTKKG